MTKRDLVGDLAYLITGCIAASCCHKGGAYRADNPRCECRGIAESLIEDREKVMEILTTSANGEHVQVRTDVLEQSAQETYPTCYCHYSGQSLSCGGKSPCPLL